MDNRPLTAWQYFWLRILYSVPVVGFIFLIVHSCSSANINRRNFACSYWCIYIIIAVVALIAFVIMMATGASVATLFSDFR